MAKEIEHKTQRVLLFGAHAHELAPEVRSYPNLEIVDDHPDVVISYGGDGTLLAAELNWPGIPKVPILNSDRGHQCLAHPAGDVIAHLALNTLVRQHYTKLECAIKRVDAEEPDCYVAALNEINVHMQRINSAVRFKLWLNGEPQANGQDVLGDGFLICTPFGSSAYFNKITRCVFWEGIGVAFNAANQYTSHFVIPESTEVRVLITRGPALLAFDSSPHFFDLGEGDELIVQKHARGATLLTYGPVQQPSKPF